MNAAQIIQFQKPSQPAQGAGKSMYSDKFDQGYVMSSRLYRKEVRPFLTDAAHNVYEQLENWINGQLKETDHVSHRQIQGGDLKGSNKLSSATVSSGLKELIWFEVITVVEKNNKIGNKYRINEVSLVEYFEQFSALEIKALRFSNKSTSISKALQLVKRQHFSNESDSALVSGASIDTPIDPLENNKNKAPSDFVAQDRGALNFIEYHLEDRKLYTLKDLFGTYPVKKDFMAQAAVSSPKLSQEIVLGQLYELCEWSSGKPERTSQAWMVTWLKWLRNYQPAKPQAPKASKKSNSNLNVNDAWKNQATHHTPATGTVEIPEDFV